MSEAIWSSFFARRIAETLGYDVLGTASETGAIPFTADAEAMVRDVTEAFRYLPPDKTQLALDFTEFLRAYKVEGALVSLAVRQSWVLEKLTEVRDLVHFLRSRFGEAQPADEKDYWTEEDRRDAQAESHRRLEERDPYSWEEPDDARAG